MAVAEARPPCSAPHRGSTSKAARRRPSYIGHPGAFGKLPDARARELGYAPAEVRGERAPGHCPPTRDEQRELLSSNVHAAASSAPRPRYSIASSIFWTTWILKYASRSRALAA